MAPSHTHSPRIAPSQRERGRFLANPSRFHASWPAGRQAVRSSRSNNADIVHSWNSPVESNANLQFLRNRIHILSKAVGGRVREQLQNWQNDQGCQECPSFYSSFTDPRQHRLRHSSSSSTSSYSCHLPQHFNVKSGWGGGESIPPPFLQKRLRCHSVDEEDSLSREEQPADQSERVTGIWNWGKV